MMSMPRNRSARLRQLISTLRAIVGGIASSLIQPAGDYLRSGPRRLLDPAAIAQHAAQGVKQGHLALRDAIDSSAVALKAIVNRLDEAFQPLPQRPIPVDLIGLRIVAERLQFPDASDPAVANTNRIGPLTITLTVALTGSATAYTVIDQIEIPTFQSGGAFVDLDRVLYQGVVQSGESLVVQVVAGAAGPAVADDQVRFTDTIDGNPSNWIGSHTPSRRQAWRTTTMVPH